MARNRSISARVMLLTSSKTSASERLFSLESALTTGYATPPGVSTGTRSSHQVTDLKASPHLGATSGVRSGILGCMAERKVTCTDCSVTEELENCTVCKKPVCPRHRSGTGRLKDGYQ